tara:strand:- start:86 stop:877 length:792 start_codon:yes stop_codon:yes gene_type:complete
MWEYFPHHHENKMGHEGDVELARKNYLENKTNNLDFLLYKRYNWMNKYIKKNQKVIELGSGAGFLQFYLNQKIILSDVIKREYIDKKIDAMDIQLSDNSVDVFICSHMIHHVPKPTVFLKSLEKKLVPGGLILVQEINTSFFMRLILYIMRHEGYSYKRNVYDESTVSNDPLDPWSANCAIPEMLFKDKTKFETAVPLKIIYNKLNEFLIFPLSGGVIAKSKTIVLPIIILKAVDIFDRLVISVFPRLVAFGRSVVLKKIVEV